MQGSIQISALDSTRPHSLLLALSPGVACLQPYFIEVICSELQLLSVLTDSPKIRQGTANSALRQTLSPKSVFGIHILASNDVPEVPQIN